MIDAIRENKHLAAKFLKAGFFFGDLETGAGKTSKPLRRLGFTDKEMRDGTYQRRIHPDDRETYMALWERVNAGWEDDLYVEYRLADRSGAWHWIETHAVVVGRKEDGTIAQVVGTDRLITARKNAELFLERQAREAMRKLEVAEALFRTGTIVTADRDLKTRLREAIERVSEIVDFDRCDVYAEEDGERTLVASQTIHCDGPAPPCDQLCRDAVGATFPIIHDDLGPLGAYRSCVVVPLETNEAHVGTVMLWHADAGHYRGSDLYPLTAVASVFAVAIYNHRLYSSTVSELEHDELTGFLTRKSFDRDAPAVWREYGSRHRHNAVAMIDIDHFKGINDTYGHQKGDEVIRGVAEVIRRNLRTDDLLGRYGGEEFVLVLPNINRTRALETLERIRGACESLDLCEFAGNVTISAGLAATDDICAPRHAVELAAYIQSADRSLYEAKRSGRNRVVASRPDTGCDDTDTPLIRGA